jgi:tetratricopeptide (TPR) repeat protein
MLAAREVRADVLLAHNRQSRAIDDLEALAALEPDRPERTVALGLAQARAGRREAAVRGLGQAAERFPQSAAVFRALGQVWLDGADGDDPVVLDKAIAALARAAGLPGANADVRTLLARARLRRGDIPGAERELRAATEHLPVPPAAYRLLGDVLERQRQWEDARAAYVRYAALTTGSSGAAEMASHIGQLSMRLRDPHTAAYWFEKALADAGPSAELLFRLASAESSRGATAAARELVTRGLALEPGHAGLRALARTLS